MFSKRSPLNHRDEVEDVILLFTDGHPTSRAKDLEPLLRLVSGNSTELKGKNVTIIGVAAGQQQVRRDFIHFIKNWTSSVFETEMNELDLKILANSIMDPLCGNAPRKYWFMI